MAAGQTPFDPLLVLAQPVRRNLIMPGFWARRWRLPIPSTRYAGIPRSSSPISFTTAVAI